MQDFIASFFQIWKSNLWDKFDFFKLVLDYYNQAIQELNYSQNQLQVVYSSFYDNVFKQRVRAILHESVRLVPFGLQQNNKGNNNNGQQQNNQNGKQKGQPQQPHQQQQQGNSFRQRNAPPGSEYFIRGYYLNYGLGLIIAISFEKAKWF